MRATLLTAILLLLPATAGRAEDAGARAYLYDSFGSTIPAPQPYESAGLIEFPRLACGALEYPHDLFVDARGDLYVADTGHARILKLSPAARCCGRSGTHRWRARSACSWTSGTAASGLPTAPRTRCSTSTGKGRSYGSTRRRGRTCCPRDTSIRRPGCSSTSGGGCSSSAPARRAGSSRSTPTAGSRASSARIPPRPASCAGSSGRSRAPSRSGRSASSRSSPAPTSTSPRTAPW